MPLYRLSGKAVVRIKQSGVNALGMLTGEKAFGGGFCGCGDLPVEGGDLL